MNKNLAIWIPIIASLLGGAYFLGNDIGKRSVDSDKLSLVENKLRLENKIKELQKKNDTLKLKYELQRKALERFNVNLSDEVPSSISEQWDGEWIQTYDTKNGEFSGKMDLKVIWDDIEAIADNSLGGTSILTGKISSDGSTINGNWQNQSNNDMGTFRFELVSQNYFKGFYAMAGNEIVETKNKWNGIKLR